MTVMTEIWAPYIFRMFCHSARSILASDCGGVWSVESYAGMYFNRVCSPAQWMAQRPAKTTPTLPGWKNWNRSHLWWLHNNPEDISGSQWSVFTYQHNYNHPKIGTLHWSPHKADSSDWLWSLERRGKRERRLNLPKYKPSSTEFSWKFQEMSDIHS